MLALFVVTVVGTVLPSGAEPSACQGTISEGHEWCEFTYTGGQVRIATGIAGASAADFAGQTVVTIPMVTVSVGTKDINGVFRARMSCSGAACARSAPLILDDRETLWCSATVRFQPFTPKPPTAALGAFWCSAGV